MRVARCVCARASPTFAAGHEFYCKGKVAVEALGLQLWLEEVVESEALRPRVVPQVLDMVAADRAGTVVSEQLILQVIQMLTDLGPGAYEKVRQAPPLRTGTSPPSRRGRF